MAASDKSAEPVRKATEALSPDSPWIAEVLLYPFGSEASIALRYFSHLWEQQGANGSAKRVLYQVHREKDLYQEAVECLPDHDGSTSTIQFQDSLLRLDLKTLWENGPVDVSGTPRFYVVIKLCSLKSVQHITQFLAEASSYNYEESNMHVLVYTYNPSHGMWTMHSRQPKRHRSTIFLPELTLEKVFQDATDFEASEKEYADFGQPWKRVYLFHGPPGTGKTSLATALASKLNRYFRVYHFDQCCKDSVFLAAVSGLGSKDLLLLEDIDLSIEKGLSLDCLTNFLDGALRTSGMMVVLTTNNPQRLDVIIKRAGRIDLEVKFGYASLAEIEKLVQRFFPAQNHTATAVAKHFERYLDKLTMAMLTRYFFQNRRCQDILARVAADRDTILAQESGIKPEMKNVYI